MDPVAERNMRTYNFVAECNMGTLRPGQLGFAVTIAGYRHREKVGPSRQGYFEYF